MNEFYFSWFKMVLPDVDYFWYLIALFENALVHYFSRKKSTSGFTEATELNRRKDTRFLSKNMTDKWKKKKRIDIFFFLFLKSFDDGSRGAFQIQIHWFLI